MEHIIVYDGQPPEDVKKFMEAHKKDYNLKFVSIPKDYGNMKDAPGTRPRNFGVSLATAPYCCFFDDDDRCSSLYIESLITDLREGVVTVVQMSCAKNRMMIGGDPNEIILIPEIGLYHFPICCHVGTPCFCVPTAWAKAEPWRHEPEHDFRFIKRICEKYNPIIQIKGGLMVDVDGLVVQGLRDWVSTPPFYRE
jgi:hypothetical protein